MQSGCWDGAHVWGVDRISSLHTIDVSGDAPVIERTNNIGGPDGGVEQVAAAQGPPRPQRHANGRGRRRRAAASAAALEWRRRWRRAIGDSGARRAIVEWTSGDAPEGDEREAVRELFFLTEAKHAPAGKGGKA